MKTDPTKNISENVMTPRQLQKSTYFYIFTYLYVCIYICYERASKPANYKTRASYYDYCTNTSITHNVWFITCV